MVGLLGDLKTLLRMGDAGNDPARRNVRLAEGLDGAMPECGLRAYRRCSWYDRAPPIRTEAEQRVGLARLRVLWLACRVWRVGFGLK